MFASFLRTTTVDLKELGFALAVVVLIDAVITRRLLPAARRLIGDTAWTWVRPRSLALAEGVGSGQGRRPAGADGRR